MQRYRVNYTLLAVLLVGILVCTGGVYALWSFQVERKADGLVVAADEARSQGRYRKEIEHLRNYLSVRPDDREVELRYANAMIDIGRREVKVEDWTFKDASNAHTLAEVTLRKYDDADELRRRQLDWMLKSSDPAYKMALPHVESLLNRHPDDSELMRMRAQCLKGLGDTRNLKPYLFKLVGYDEAADTFDASKALAPDEEQVYSLLAGELRDDRRPELADRVMNQLIEVNPEKVEAYLQRSMYRRRLASSDFTNADRHIDDAKADLEKAYNLAPDNVDVLLSKVDLDWYALRKDRKEEIEADPTYSFSAEDVAPFLELLNAAKKSHPDDIRVYTQLVQFELAKKDKDAARRHVEEGLTQIEERQRPLLLLYMADLQIGDQDVASVRETIEQLRKIEYVNPSAIRMLEARCLMIEERWFEAQKLLAESRPELGQNPASSAQVDFLLGMCHERLGQLDLALDRYKSSLAALPSYEMAEAGLARVESALGTAERSDLDELLRTDLVRIMLQPKEQQDWAAFDEQLNKALEKSDLPSAVKLLHKADVQTRRGNFAKARELLKQAYREDKESFQVRLAAAKLVAEDPDRGPAQAIQMLEGLIADPKFGDNFLVRLVKADLLIALHNSREGEKDDAKLKEQLFALTEGIDTWNSGQKAQLWTGLSDKFARMRMADEARLCRERVAEVSPNELPARVDLFKMALQEQDDEGMAAAQKAILEIVGSKDNPTWQSTEAQRLLSLVARGQGGEELVDRAEALVSKALVHRREWNELILLQAQIALSRGQESRALDLYKKAIGQGQIPFRDTILYTNLLVRRGRWVDARAALEKSNNPSLLQRSNFGQLYATILLNTGSLDDALKTADVVIETDPENAAKQLWYGQFALQLARSDKKFEVKTTTDEQGANDKLIVESAEMSAAERNGLASKLQKAGNALAKAVELAPGVPDAWLAWIEFLARTGQGDRAGEAIRLAQIALPEDEQPILLAKSYEITGRWFDAENRYRAAMESRPDNVQAMRWLAAFYLGNGYRLKDKQERAIPLINDILKAAAAGKADPHNEHVLWARRIAAQTLAETGDYQNALKAERLLNANAADGVLAVEDQLRLAQMLARRPEPSSRLKAEQLLTEVKRNHAVTMEADMILGQLMYVNGRVSGKWDDARRHMVELIARYPNAEAPRAQFIRMLLERGGNTDLKVAKQHLGRLAEVAKDSTTVMQLNVELAIKTGQQREAFNSLSKLVPSDLTKVPPEQLPILGRVAELFSQLEEYEAAETLYRFIAGKDPRFIPSLIVFLGTKRDVKDSFDMLEQLQGKLSPPVLIQSALAVLRERRNDVGNEFDGQLQTWLDRALRENPESITLLLQRAELHDMRGEYPQAAEIYRGLRNREDVEGRERAIILNNLAFLLALGGTEEATNGESLRLVEEAIELNGPSADILDTRAVVYNAQKQYSQAIADIDQSLMDTPTASKWYHKAVAHIGANQIPEARQAWKEAEKLGLGTDTNALNRMELEQYEQIKKQIENPELRSASL